MPEDFNQKIVLDAIHRLSGTVEASQKELSGKIDQVRESVQSLDGRITKLETWQDLYWNRRLPEVEKQLASLDATKSTKESSEKVEKDLRDVSAKVSALEANAGKTDIKIKIIMAVIGTVAGGIGSFIMSLILNGAGK